MHSVIRLIVEARSVENAKERAERFFQSRISPNYPYEWATVMDDVGSTTGANRWESYENEELAFSLDSERGRNEAIDAWNSTIEERKSILSRIYEQLDNYDDVESFTSSALDNEDGIMHTLSLVNTYGGEEVFLFFDQAGQPGISRPVQWEKITDLLESERAETKYIVPMDAHF